MKGCESESRTTCVSETIRRRDECDVLGVSPEAGLNRGIIERTTASARANLADVESELEAVLCRARDSAAKGTIVDPGIAYLP